ncbi:MAG: hypothetical protein ACYTBJ_23565, partial [Planctomycetota bacterium]
MAGEEVAAKEGAEVDVELQLEISEFMEEFDLIIRFDGTLDDGTKSFTIMDGPLQGKTFGVPKGASLADGYEAWQASIAEVAEAAEAEEVVTEEEEVVTKQERAEFVKARDKAVEEIRLTEGLEDFDFATTERPRLTKDALQTMQTDDEWRSLSVDALAAILGQGFLQLTKDYNFSSFREYSQEELVRWVEVYTQMYLDLDTIPSEKYIDPLYMFQEEVRDVFPGFDVTATTKKGPKFFSRGKKASHVASVIRMLTEQDAFDDLTDDAVQVMRDRMREFVFKTAETPIIENPAEELSEREQMIMEIRKGARKLASRVGADIGTKRRIPILEGKAAEQVAESATVEPEVTVTPTVEVSELDAQRNELSQDMFDKDYAELTEKQQKLIDMDIEAMA